MIPFKVAIFGSILFFLAASGVAQESQYRLQIDTLERINDSAFFKISNYRSGKLSDEGTAFLFPDTHKIARFRIFGRGILRNTFTRPLYLLNVMRHGERTEYLTADIKRISEYNYGKRTKSKYFDAGNNEILSPVDSNMINNYRGPCKDDCEEIILLGTKKSSNKKKPLLKYQ